MTHDYERHGTTTLFAAMNVLDGTVIGRNMQRHRHQEFIRFLNVIEKQVPVGKTIHAIVDNYAAHKHPNVRRWLERHPRWTLHFTPTSASWLNAVEGLLRNPHKAQAQARRLSLRRRPASRDQPLPRRAQSAIEGLHLDRQSRRNHRRTQARAPSVRFDPLVRLVQGCYGCSGTSLGLSAIRPSSGSERAFIFRIALLRWTFTGASAMPISPAICLLRRPRAT